MSFSRSFVLTHRVFVAARQSRLLPVAAPNCRPRWLSTKEEKEKIPTVTATDLADMIADEHELSKIESKRIISSLFDSITEAVANKKKVSINNFGFFQIMHAKSRQGRNPSTGEIMTIPAKERVKFKAFQNLKDAVNKE